MSLLVRYKPPGENVGIGVVADGLLVPVPALTSMAAAFALPVQDLQTVLTDALAARNEATDVERVRLLAPLDGRCEVWGAGVTYERSRQARGQESARAGIYDQVYDADRPELFYKAAAWQVRTDQDPVRVRADSTTDVPEPELALAVNRHAEVVGYLVCDDVSSRTLEGENPLYLPQAKIYAGSCAVQAGIRPAWEVPDPRALSIAVEVRRADAVVWQDRTSTARLHRPLTELVQYLFRDQEFPDGVVLSTGTGLVPGLEFTLEPDDQIEITISEVGTLVNYVAARDCRPSAWMA